MNLKDAIAQHCEPRIQALALPLFKTPSSNSIRENDRLRVFRRVGQRGWCFCRSVSMKLAVRCHRISRCRNVDPRGL